MECLIVRTIFVIFFMNCVNIVINQSNHEITLKEGSQAFNWWKSPPVMPQLKFYIYNVTNADEFLNNGSKPVVEEIGPYVYFEKWDRKNLKFNPNGTVSFNQQKIFKFQESLSIGSEDDMVVVPNIPMLSTTSNAKHSARFLKLAMASVMAILQVTPFIEVSVKQLLWGYEDLLTKISKDISPWDPNIPYNEFGLMYKKNGTSEDTLTINTGADDIIKYGLIDKWNGKSEFGFYTTDKCNSIEASDGTIFPPNITKNTTLHIFDKSLCRRLPLIFDKEVKASGDITAYRFTPPENVFASVEQNPENICFCPQGPPCAPSGFFNISACQYKTPYLISFPHFYLANDSYRTAFDGISPPDKENHSFYLDVNPVIGCTMAAKARIQINLAVSHVMDIKQVSTFPEIIFPIIWFEEGLESLSEEMTKWISLATIIPPKTQSNVSGVAFDKEEQMVNPPKY